MENMPQTPNVKKYINLNNSLLTCYDGEFCRAVWIGMIIQLSAICTDRMAPLQARYLSVSKNIWSSGFDDRPAKLFDGLEHIRASVLINEIGDGNASVSATGLLRWNSDSREQLFRRINYSEIADYIVPGSFPKLGSEAHMRLVDKVKTFDRKAGEIHRPSSDAVVYYYRSPLYWIRAMDFLPHFSSASANRSVHHFKDFRLTDSAFIGVVGSIINSSLFYIWFISYGNGRNVALRDILTFPIPDSLLSDKSAKQFGKKFKTLMLDYVENSTMRSRRDGVQYQEFYPSRSKSAIDQIDTLLAEHYGFSEEELDFIINYDIKFRMGLSAGVADEDDDE